MTTNLILPPQTHITTCFGAHGSRLDFGGLKTYDQRIRQHDIYCLEGINWDETLKKSLQKAAKDDYKAREKAKSIFSQVRYSEYHCAQVDLLYNTKLIIEMPDYKAGSQAGRKLDTHLKNRAMNLSKSIYENIVVFKPKRIQDFEMQAARNLFVAQAICDIADWHRNANPKISAWPVEKPLKIFVQFGMRHSEIADHLQPAVDKGEGCCLERWFLSSTTTLAGTFEQEYKATKTLSDIAVALLLVEDLMLKVINSTTGSRTTEQSILEVEAQIADKSLAELAEIWLSSCEEYAALVR